MNGKRSGVDRPMALNDLAAVIDADQVGDLDQAKVHPERIDPERVDEFRIARGDVTDHPLVKAEFREQPEACRKALLAMQALLADRLEYRWARQVGIHFFRGGGGILKSL